ncbi:sulfurtransferase-like selenium metabolism protein YedF [Thermophilibacter provencensis]|uniref:Sulfurtransferase-like selenium metabolism protein YedF n=1 Tax=Thermophilibacter provencensis TaxID=1852386 RepID=A0ABT7V0L0_9ACTN|nr:sulfurtransferase-like selenium metabolism protein YedF [Thermophilibacter provencensis]MDM8270139.1 sulfurtransferase-like selenium metabolism protein YedF [Thermophilibacter provencensis]
MAETVLTIDARGEACPIPVVRTLKALGALAGPGSVETLVDNEIAVQNLTRMGEGKGCTVASERLGEKEWRVTVTTSVALGVSDAEAESATCEVPVPGAAAARKNVVVAITSECMGVGDDVLGKKLMGSFVYSLTQLDELPACVLLYNGGAHLSCEGSAALEDLRGLAASGVEVLTCGTCLDHYGIADTLAVGEVTNMYVIAQRLTGASLVVRP